MAIRFVKVQNPEPVVDHLVRAIRTRLDARQPVLWFISGGSAIPVETEVAGRLGPADGLTISLTDERPGPVGHANSNAAGLRAAGFPLPFHEILTDKGSAAEAEAFADYLQSALATAAYAIGLFGIGPDGHTAGIPHAHAPAATGLAAYYAVEDFKRISMTPAAIARLDEVAVIALGEAKRAALDQLERDEPITTQSAQALKAVSRVTIFNDIKGEPA